MSSNDSTKKKYLQDYYLKNKQKIKEKNKMNYDKLKVSLQKYWKRKNYKAYRMRCLRYNQKCLKMNSPITPLTDSNDRSIFVLDLY